MQPQTPIVHRGTRMHTADGAGMTVAAILRSEVECVTDKHRVVYVSFADVEAAVSRGSTR